MSSFILSNVNNNVVVALETQKNRLKADNYFAIEINFLEHSLILLITN